jgi:hypothetical protein
MRSPRLARTPDGRRLEVAREANARAAAAWDLLTDTRRWPEWGPSVGAVDCSERYIRMGSRGRVRVASAWLPFEVRSFTSPGEETGRPGRWTWRVAGVPATSHRVEPLGEGRCRIVFEVPPLAAPYTLVCDRALDTLVRLAERA